MVALVTPGDWNHGAGSDLLARDATGRLWLYPGDNAGGLGPAVAIGSGWNVMDYLG